MLAKHRYIQPNIAIGIVSNNKTIKSVCPYCGVGCGIIIETANGKTVKVSGDKEHPTNFGRLCTKGNTCIQAIAESGRADAAYMRKDRSHDPVRVSMDAAISETARHLRAILDEHGPDALSFYVSGQMSLEAQYLINKLCKGFVRTNNIESNSRLCMASAGSGYKLSLGADGPPGSYQDFDQADLFFVIGANMADCHPILFLRMMDRVKAGAKLIVVDPRRSATADKATLFMQIKPGTDLALLNGLLHLLVKNDKTDSDFIARFTEGWEQMPAFLDDYAPEKVAQITGLSETDIRTAAQMMGDAPEFMTCWTMGLNQSTHGTWNTNAICNLHLATGKICRPGSGPFSLTGQPNAMGGREMGYMGPGLPGQRSVLVEKDREFIENLWQVPAGTLRTDLGGGTVTLFEDMIAGKVKACWIICTNPVASMANRKNVIAGLQAAELVITQDAFLDTESNRYADILLPGALWAEAEGVMINSERNMTLMAKATEPPGDALPDWKIIARVACEMGFADGFTYDSASDVFDEIKQAWNPKTGYDIRGASHARLREGPLQWPYAPDAPADRNPIRYLNNGISQALKIYEDGSKPELVFATPSGKGVFFARPHGDPAELPDGDFPFVLNTGRLQHQWHTMTKTGKIPTLNKLNPGPFVEIHPEDAAQLGIKEKNKVEIRSRRGRAVLPAVVTDRVRPGNCFAPFHWNDVFGEDLAINAVTNDAIDPISQQPEFKFCAVALCLVEEEPVITIPNASDTNLIASDKDAISPANTEELDIMQINALAQLLGLDAAPAVTLDAHEKLYLQGYLLGLHSEEGRKQGGVPTLPMTAPIDPAKRLVLDGVLAGLFARTWLPSAGVAPAIAAPDGSVPSSPASASSEKTALVVWTSSTGNSESFAEQCVKRLSSEGYKVRVAAMDAVKATELAETENLLVLASTFGDGDPPDNGAALWSALDADSAPTFANTRFSVLAFGDSNYDQFCGFGKKIDVRLESLGGKRITARIDCEPDYQEAATQWLNTTVSAMVSATANVSAPVPQLELAGGGDNGDDEVVSAAPTKPAYNKQNPFQSKVLLNRLLNNPGGDKETRQYIFDLKNSGLEYEAGDALGIWPTNCPALVEDIFSALKLDRNTTVTVKDAGDMRLADALTKQFEIARITPDFLQFVNTRAGSEKLATLLRDDKKPELKQWLWGRQIVDLLQEFPIKTDAQELVSVLKRLQPRLYSIASSPKAHEGEVHLTINTVRYACSGKARSGVCSVFLADRTENQPIPLFIQKSAHFHPPKDLTKPLIMVGPGTGVAPFRGFLHERKATGATGKNWLFFGEQRAATDFYYQDELETLQKEGVLHQLDTAFSRDQTEKIYVQHRMLEQGAQLWSWLEEGAYFCVCGDASRMAKDVDAALKQVIQTWSGLSKEQADAYVAKMSADKRYLKDVY